MPIQIPSLDDRRYQQLLDEALARIPVHNPEWTNFNKSDPGVTLVEVFSFLTENLLYRANQIPERNRRKFLSLLGMPLQTATPARGLVTINNERGALAAATINSGMEVRAGNVPFRTQMGLDVLPIEARVYFKRQVAVTTRQKEYYRQLYASFMPDDPLDETTLKLYETVPLPDPTPGSKGVDLGADDVVDGLWIALLVRKTDKPYEETVSLARQAIAGKVLNVGVLPYLSDAERLLNPIGQTPPDSATRLEFWTPDGQTLSKTEREPNYDRLPAEAMVNVLTTPGIIQVTLPEESRLEMWSDLDPLELGVSKFPPSLEDTSLSERLITWMHVLAPAGARAKIYWMGINVVPVTQGATVSGERLSEGTGEPDQMRKLCRTPVIPGTVKLRITYNSTTTTWVEIDDILAAGPEVPVRDPLLPPGTSVQPVLTPAEVFQLDAEAGEILFGDGAHGKRPPLGASMLADYTYSVGAAGNLGIGSVKDAPALPAGLKVSNPVPTWGGTDAETQSEAEKHITRNLQHRDRLVTVNDFETITYRTPGADVGRVEAIPAYHPKRSKAPGDAPGMVTLLVIPRYDTEHPDFPEPDRNFLNDICDYLNPRRLVTTELYITGPEYVDIWVSVGVNVVPGSSVAEVREKVKTAITSFLSPLPPVDGMPVDDTITNYASGPRGWPLSKKVADLELAAVASRVSGVMSIQDVLVIEAKTAKVLDEIPMQGLQMPRLRGVSISVGDPLSADQLGFTSGAPGGTSGTSPTGSKPPSRPLPVPVIPEECK